MILQRKSSLRFACLASSPLGSHALFVRQRRDGSFFPHDEEIGAE